jgi:hypothetical protein
MPDIHSHVIDSVYFIGLSQLSTRKFASLLVFRVFKFKPFILVYFMLILNLVAMLDTLFRSVPTRNVFHGLILAVMMALDVAKVSTVFTKMT